MMNRLLSLGLNATFGALGVVSMFILPAQAQVPPVVPMVAIPLTGGQFSVDLSIQNGQVQDYRYTNNQFPTFLTPVGTIGVISATVPSMSWQDPRTNTEINNDSMLQIFPGERVKIDNDPKAVIGNLQVTGTTQLNDGRSASFNNTNTFFLGSATASSPLVASDLSKATARLQEGETRLPLPDAYQGTIKVNIQQGGVMVPQSALSSASPTQTRLGLASGKVDLGYSGYVRHPFTNHPSGTQGLSEGLNIFDDASVGVASASRSQFNSPDAEMSLTLTNVVEASYPALAPMLATYSGLLSRGIPLSMVVNGTVNLPNGQKIAVQNRLMTVHTVSGDSPAPGRSVLNVFGGELYIDPTAIVPNPPPVAQTPDPVEVMPPSVQPSILADTTIANQIQSPVTRSQIPQKPLANNSRNLGILDSPLASSRIFPTMGALR